MILRIRESESRQPHKLETVGSTPISAINLQAEAKARVCSTYNPDYPDTTWGATGACSSPISATEINAFDLDCSAFGAALNAVVDAAILQATAKVRSCSIL